MCRSDSGSHRIWCRYCHDDLSADDLSCCYQCGNISVNLSCIDVHDVFTIQEICQSEADCMASCDISCDQQYLHAVFSIGESESDETDSWHLSFAAFHLVPLSCKR